VFSNFFFENFALYEIMWENIAESGRPQMTIRRKRNACWIHKGTNTRSECVIIIDLPLQQWLYESASMLRYSTLSVLSPPPTLYSFKISVLTIFCFIYCSRKKAVLSYTVKRKIFCNSLQELYFDCRYRKEIFLFFKTSGPTMGPTRLRTKHVLRAH
jgi:hypothetical protein